jgi:hypothetical protein
MKRGLITIVFAVLFIFSSLQIISKTATNSPKYTQEEIQRVIQLIEYRTTTKSNVEYIISNLGMVAHRDSSGTGLPGCTWPRGSQNSYIYGQGICFGAKKAVGADTNKLFHISYNPNNGKCWLVSGRIEDGTTMLFSKRTKYQVYFSDEFDKVTGEPLDPNESMNWPIWKRDNTDLGKLGLFVFDEQERDITTYSTGPAIISNQDVSCVFKDTDLTKYENSQDSLTKAGYPLKIQYEQTTYLFDDEAYKDMVILKYKIINMSTDSLRDCWFGMVSDNDLKVLGPDSGQVNDDARFYSEDQSLNLAITWTETNKGELGKGFGYIGNSLLESPAVDQNGYIRKDKSFYTPAEQLGLKTLKLFPLESDTIIFNHLYDNLSSDNKSFMIENDDIRVLLATGPFHLNPNDTAICAFMINFANTVSGGEADGSTNDVGNLITNVRSGRDLYYNKHLITKVEDDSQIPGKFAINKLYPNPADNNINTEIKIPNDGIARIDILDLIGNRVGSYNVLCQGGINSFSINTMNFSSGTYFLKISNLSDASQGVCTKVFSILK